MKQYADIQLIYDTEANLAALNLVYKKGQPMCAVDQYGNVGLKIGMWDDVNDPYNLNGAPNFVNLPWMIPPASFGASKMNVFKVTSADPAYSFAADQVVITDQRFKGKVDFPILLTQSGGGAIDPDLVTYDAINGVVTIDNIELQANGALYFILPTGIATDPDYIALNARMLVMENFNSMFFAPFLPPAPGMPGQTSFWYTGDVILLIGTPWKVNLAMAGMLPGAIDLNDADFNYAPGTIFGSKSFGITSMDQIPQHRFFTLVNEPPLFQSGNPGDTGFGRAVSNMRARIVAWYKSLGGGNYGVESNVACGAANVNDLPDVAPTNYQGKSPADPIKHIGRSVAGNWIHFDP